MTQFATSSDIESRRPKRGGAEEAIQHHYDASNAFYGLWLDETMTYSCGQWDEGDNPKDLAAAQRRKLDKHLDIAGVAQARRVLDIGCGWGSLLARALGQEGAAKTAVGLTLSAAQMRYLEAREIAGLEVRKESWVDHEPSTSYDSIVSIGAFEHFASPGDRTDDKVALYREFFGRCRSWLSNGGRMSLQTIAYGTMQAHEASDFINTHIFPDSELPRPHEILAAADGLFEVTILRNDRAQYGRTCDLWYNALRRRRAEAVTFVGEERVAQYEKYLRMSSFGFYSGQIGLLRIGLAPVSVSRQQVAPQLGR